MFEIVTLNLSYSSSDTRDPVSPRWERNTGGTCAFVPSATRCSHGYRRGWHTCELERELWAGRALTVTLWKTTHWWHIFQIECCCGVCVCVAVVTLCIYVWACVCVRTRACVCVLKSRRTRTSFLKRFIYFFSPLFCGAKLPNSDHFHFIFASFGLLLLFSYLFHPHKRTHAHVKLAFYYCKYY